MLTYLRYSLATFCFAASVGCFASWAYMASRDRQFVNVTVIGPGWLLDFQAQGGTLHIARHRVRSSSDYAVHFASTDLHEPSSENDSGPRRPFGLYEREVYFPIWYPAIMFAFAGIGVLCFRRQFSIRSVLVTVSIVAALLGMVAAL
jgi:hypothetical protein